MKKIFLVLLILALMSNFAFSLEDVSPPIDNANPNYLPGSDATTSLQTVSQTNVQLMAQVSQLSKKIDDLTTHMDQKISENNDIFLQQLSKMFMSFIANLVIVLLAFFVFFWVSVFLFKAKGWF